MIITDTLPITGPCLSGFSFPEDHELLIIGDCHGQAAALRRLLDALGKMPRNSRDRSLVFTGDLIDRGPDSLGCLTAALHEAQSRAKADHLGFLPGNHELMLTDAIEAAFRGDDGALLDGTPGGAWVHNGGYPFMVEVMGAQWGHVSHVDADDLLSFSSRLPHPGHATFPEMIRSWPSHLRMGDVLCVHAGIAPKHPLSYTLDLDQHCHFPPNRFDYHTSDRHWAWIRDNFLVWQGGWPASGKGHNDGVMVIHGHSIPARVTSPGRNLEDPEVLKRIFSRLETNARICIDGGAARGVGIAAAVITSHGARVAFEPA